MLSGTCSHCGGAVSDTDRSCPSCKRGLAGRALLANAAYPPVNATPASCILLVLAALGVAFFGAMMLSQATAGVGIVAFACLLMIWARIAQASAHHNDVMKKLHDQQQVQMQQSVR